MIQPIYGHAFSPEVLAQVRIPAFNREALPYLLRDRKEAVEGSMIWSAKEGKQIPDGSGLEKAQQELRRLRLDLAAEHNPNHPPTNRYQILAIMVGKQECAVQFWEGKLWLLDQMIAQAKAAPSPLPSP